MQIRISKHDNLRDNLLQSIFLTIRQCAEDGCRTEAAVTSLRSSPNLHFVLSGPAEVCQHHLVSAALCEEALIITASVLQGGKKTKTKQNQKRGVSQKLKWILGK